MVLQRKATAAASAPRDSNQGTIPSRGPKYMSTPDDSTRACGGQEQVWDPYLACPTVASRAFKHPTK